MNTWMEEAGAGSEILAVTANSCVDTDMDTLFVGGGALPLGPPPPQPARTTSPTGGRSNDSNTGLKDLAENGHFLRGIFGAWSVTLLRNCLAPPNRSERAHVLQLSRPIFRNVCGEI
jgi:hypothetical protein